MHELSLTQDLVEAVCDRMRDYPGKRVTRVVMEVGKLAAVFPDAMSFCFEVCAKGTAAEGARLEMLELPGRELRIKHLEVE